MSQLERKQTRLFAINPIRPSYGRSCSTSPALRHEDKFDGLVVKSSFVFPDTDGEMHLGQRVLPLILEYGHDDAPHWRSILAREDFPMSFGDLRAAAIRGIDTNFVHIVADAEPHTMPTFLMS